MRIVGIGEILYDVFPDCERLGGAPFNFAAHASRLGHEVLFLSAVGEDERGLRALREAQELGLSTEFIRTVPGAPTGIVSVDVDPAGQPSFTIHRPAAYDQLSLSAEDLARIAGFQPGWVCFGTLHQSHPPAKALTSLVLEACPSARRFYDINLRRDSYTDLLVEELMLAADVVKLNDAEAAEVSRMFGVPCNSISRFLRYWAERCGWSAACVTLGEKGCAVLVDDEFVEVPCYPVQVRDTVGAGDAFAAAFLHGLSQGLPAAEIADFSNRVGALVASRPGAVPAWTLEECSSLRRIGSLQ
jgi:fructokinase